MHRQYFQAPGCDRLLSARITNSGLTPTMAGSKHPRRSTLVALVVTVLLGTLALSGCVVSEHTHGEHGAEGAGHEHADPGVVRLGARLILAHSAEDNAVVGTVQNTTDETLPQVWKCICPTALNSVPQLRRTLNPVRWWKWFSAQRIRNSMVGHPTRKLAVPNTDMKVKAEVCAFIA